MGIFSPPFGSGANRLPYVQSLFICYLIIMFNRMQREGSRNRELFVL